MLAHLDHSCFTNAFLGLAGITCLSVTPLVPHQAPHRTLGCCWLYHTANHLQDSWFASQSQPLEVARCLLKMMQKGVWLSANKTLFTKQASEPWCSAGHWLQVISIWGLPAQNLELAQLRVPEGISMDVHYDQSATRRKL